MRHVHIAIGIIQQGNKLLLQRRKSDPRVGGAGLIGCFGGKIDDGEDPINAFCREVFEETLLKPLPRDVKKLGIVKVKSDHNLEPVEVTAHVYHWHYKNVKVPKIEEGELIIMTKKEAMASLDKFTTGTRAVFEELV
jgi:8-oxo-dGTP pyrophosphatase MutT (NUDIX family)